MGSLSTASESPKWQSVIKCKKLKISTPGSDGIWSITVAGRTRKEEKKNKDAAVNNIAGNPAESIPWLS